MISCSRCVSMSLCVVVVCPDPDPADPNGSVQSGSTTYLSTAVYSCNNGYLLDTSEGGSQVVTCQADGSWSDTAPGCIRKGSYLVKN